MITQEQSDKIAEQIIQRHQREVYQPLMMLLNIARNIIPDDVYRKTIDRKKTWGYYREISSANTHFDDYGDEIEITTYGCLKIVMCYNICGVRSDSLDFKISSHGFNNGCTLFDALEKRMENIACYSIAKLVFPKKTDEPNQKKIHDDNHKRDFNKELNGANVKKILDGLNRYFILAENFINKLKENIEELSNKITNAYNDALEKEREDDAMVLKEFGLLPDSIERESFEVKINVVKVNLNNKSTKKGKK